MAEYMVPICLQTGRALCTTRAKATPPRYGMVNDADRAWRGREHYHTPRLPFHYFFDEAVYAALRDRMLDRGASCDELPRDELHFHLASLRGTRAALLLHAPPPDVLPVLLGQGGGRRALRAEGGGLLRNTVALLGVPSQAGYPADFVRVFAAERAAEVRAAAGQPCVDVDVDADAAFGRV